MIQNLLSNEFLLYDIYFWVCRFKKMIKATRFDANTCKSLLTFSWCFERSEVFYLKSKHFIIAFVYMCK